MVRRYSAAAAVLVMAALAGCSSEDTDSNDKSPTLIERHGGIELIYEIRADQGEVPDDLAERMIEILKRRVDPTGIGSGGLEWRPMGKDRFAVRMPTGNALAPDDLKRLIAKAGLLEFRIAPALPGSKEESMPISEEDYKRYTTSLSKEGPEGAAKRNEQLQWFPIKGKPEDYRGVVVAEHAGQSYMLLHTRPHNTMLQPHGRSDWGLKRSYPTTDNRNSPAIGFEFDERGAKRFAALTGAHVGHFMAVLLDGTVYSCPMIREAIRDRGIINGKFTKKEVDELVRILEAGSLPARLNPVPVSESRFGPALGKTVGK